MFLIIWDFWPLATNISFENLEICHSEIVIAESNQFAILYPFNYFPCVFVSIFDYFSLMELPNQSFPGNINPINIDMLLIFMYELCSFYSYLNNALSDMRFGMEEWDFERMAVNATLLLLCIPHYNNIKEI